MLTPKSVLLCRCLVQVGNGIELKAVGLQFKPYQWRPCGVTWDSSRTVVVIKLRRTSALDDITELPGQNGVLINRQTTLKQSPTT